MYTVVYIKHVFRYLLEIQSSDILKISYRSPLSVLIAVRSEKMGVTLLFRFLDKRSFSKTSYKCNYAFLFLRVSTFFLNQQLSVVYPGGNMSLRSS